MADGIVGIQLPSPVVFAVIVIGGGQRAAVTGRIGTGAVGGYLVAGLRVAAVDGLGDLTDQGGGAEDKKGDNRNSGEYFTSP